MILLFYGLVSSISSFVISFNVTTEVLKCMHNQDIVSEINNEDEFNLFKFENRNKVKFNQNVNFIIIPSFRDLSSDNINELWYTDDEFNKFKIEIIKSRIEKKIE